MRVAAVNRLTAAWCVRSCHLSTFPYTAGLVEGTPHPTHTPCLPLALMIAVMSVFFGARRALLWCSHCLSSYATGNAATFFLNRLLAPRAEDLGSSCPFWAAWPAAPRCAHHSAGGVAAPPGGRACPAHGPCLPLSHRYDVSTALVTPIQAPPMRRLTWHLPSVPVCVFHGSHQRIT